MLNKLPNLEYNVIDDIIRLRNILDNIIVSYSKLIEIIYSPDGTHPALETPRLLLITRRKGIARNRFLGWI